MIKLVDIALKDLRRAFRSRFLLVFMFVVPLLVTGLFALMFGGSGEGEDGAYTLPRTVVRVVNLDEGRPADLPAGSGMEAAPGALLLDLLQGETFADLMDVAEAPDEASARAAVDAGEAGVALIIPPGFSAALLEPDRVAAVELYADPALTLGPAVVETVVTQLVEQMAARKLHAEVALGQLAQAGIPPDETLLAAVSSGGGGGWLQPVIEPPPGVDLPESGILAQILGLIMGGMLVFFAFFTGAVSMETLLTEAEEGTLPRLFSTPTPPLAVLGGRVLASFLILLVQVSVLFLGGRLAFGIDWGALPSLLLAGGGIVLLALGTGLFVISFLSSTRQAGIVFGGVLTLTGMLGLLPVFTAGSGGNSTVALASLLVPQGWAVRGLQISMERGGVADLLPTLAVTLIWVVVLAGLGFARLRGRFTT